MAMADDQTPGRRSDSAYWCEPVVGTQPRTQPSPAKGERQALVVEHGTGVQRFDTCPLVAAAVANLACSGLNDFDVLNPCRWPCLLIRILVSLVMLIATCGYIFLWPLVWCYIRVCPEAQNSPAYQNKWHVNANDYLGTFSLCLPAAMPWKLVGRQEVRTSSDGFARTVRIMSWVSCVAITSFCLLQPTTVLSSVDPPRPALPRECMNDTGGEVAGEAVGSRRAARRADHCGAVDVGLFAAASEHKPVPVPRAKHLRVLPVRVLARVPQQRENKGGHRLRLRLRLLLLQRCEGETAWPGRHRVH